MHGLFKSTLSCAVGAVLASTAFGAQAVAVVSWDLQDFDNDGLRSDLMFEVPPTGNGPNAFGATDERCGAGACLPMIFDSGPIGTDVFTTGFNFGGAGDFKPNVTGSLSADITDGVLSFSAFDFGGRFPGVGGAQFVLDPDPDLGAVTIETLTDLGGGNWGVVIRYLAIISGAPTADQHAYLRVEGVMTTVPLPGAAALLGAGLAALGGFLRRRAARVCGVRIKHRVAAARRRHAC